MARLALRLVSRFLTVGFACALLHNAIMLGGYWLGLHYAVSSVISFVIVVVFGYWLHSTWSFPDAERGRTPFARYALIASANLPLQDQVLAAIDRALGLDWKGLLAWMNASPTIYDMLRPIYLSLTLQMTAVALCLAFSGRLMNLRVYTLAFIFAGAFGGAPLKCSSIPGFSSFSSLFFPSHISRLRGAPAYGSCS